MNMPAKQKKETIHLKWAIPEFEKYDRGLAWYITMGFIALLLLIYAIYARNFLFAVIIILVGFIVYLHNRQEPQLLDFQITEEGIGLGKKFFFTKN